MNTSLASPEKRFNENQTVVRPIACGTVALNRQSTNMRVAAPDAWKDHRSHRRRGGKLDQTFVVHRPNTVVCGGATTPPLMSSPKGLNPSEMPRVT